MSRLHVLLAVTAGLATTSIAQADLFSSINSFATAPRWFGDYPNSTVNITNGGLASLRFQESDYTSSTGFATRNLAALSVNGTPYQFDPAQGFQVDTNVTINSNSFATEAGITIGSAPNFPNSAAANMGDFHIRVPDGEIAAFGGVNPFFSNNQHPLGNGNDPVFPTITTGTTYHMTLIYNTSIYGSSMNFGVNGVFTGNLACSQLLPGTIVAMFAQGPNNTPVSPGYLKDVTFTNTAVVVPAPASFGLLGLGGLLAARRRR
jgi:hypothetical protein